MSINVEVLSDIVKQATAEIIKLRKENEMLTQECSALRDQLKYAEQQVYNGSTM